MTENNNKPAALPSPNQFTSRKEAQELLDEILHRAIKQSNHLLSVSQSSMDLDNGNWRLGITYTYNRFSGFLGAMLARTDLSIFNKKYSYVIKGERDKATTVPSDGTPGHKVHVYTVISGDYLFGHDLEVKQVRPFKTEKVNRWYRDGVFFEHTFDKVLEVLKAEIHNEPLDWGLCK